MSDFNSATDFWWATKKLDSDGCREKSTTQKESETCENWYIYLNSDFQFYDHDGYK